MTRLRRYLRYLVLGLRILVPTRAELRYVRAIRESGLFDRSWYLTTNPRLPWICRVLPERHYVLVGETVGLCPSPGFSPRAYASRTPAVAAEACPPFWHYIREGRFQGRDAADRPAGGDAPVLPAVGPDLRPEVPAPFAVVLHLFYRSMWSEIAERLRSQLFDFDLFVTLTAEDPAADAAMALCIGAEMPGARVIVFPNHGRDLLPFLHLAQSGLLEPYLAVCKLHTKKSPHRLDGDAWRAALLDGVLGDPARTAARLAAFVRRPDAAFWTADGHLLQGSQWWGPNRERALALLERQDIAPSSGPLRFAAGSIYWVGAAMVKRLERLRLESGDFEAEVGQVDGTTAHALERALGPVAEAAGLALVESRDLDAVGENPGISGTGVVHRRHRAGRSERPDSC